MASQTFLFCDPSLKVVFVTTTLTDIIETYMLMIRVNVPL